MTKPPDRQRRSGGDPSATAAHGTSFPVRTGVDRRGVEALAIFLAGPLIWSVHFLVVYGVAEAGCTGDGPGLRVFDPPVPTVLTLAATGVGALACLATAWWAHRRWSSSRRVLARDDPDVGEPGRDEDGDVIDLVRSLAAAGMMLSVVSLFAVLLVGLPAAVLAPC